MPAHIFVMDRSNYDICLRRGVVGIPSAREGSRAKDSTNNALGPSETHTLRKASPTAWSDTASELATQPSRPLLHRSLNFHHLSIRAWSLLQMVETNHSRRQRPRYRRTSFAPTQTVAKLRSGWRMRPLHIYADMPVNFPHKLHQGQCCGPELFLHSHLCRLVRLPAGQSVLLPYADAVNNRWWTWTPTARIELAFHFAQSLIASNL